MPGRANKTGLNKKVDHALDLIEKSEAFAALFHGKNQDWAGIFAELDEDDMDDLLLILEHEEDLYDEVNQAALRKKKVNETRYKQRMEKLNFELDKKIEQKNNSKDNA